MAGLQPVVTTRLPKSCKEKSIIVIATQLTRFETLLARVEALVNEFLIFWCGIRHETHCHGVCSPSPQRLQKEQEKENVFDVKHQFESDSKVISWPTTCIVFIWPCSKPYFLFILKNGVNTGDFPLCTRSGRHYCRGHSTAWSFRSSREKVAQAYWLYWRIFWRKLSHFRPKLK